METVLIIIYMRFAFFQQNRKLVKQFHIALFAFLAFHCEACLIFKLVFERYSPPFFRFTLVGLLSGCFSNSDGRSESDPWFIINRALPHFPETH